MYVFIVYNVNTNKQIINVWRYKMFIRLEVKYGRKWKLGLNIYENKEKANERIEELRRVGIKARVKLNDF